MITTAPKVSIILVNLNRFSLIYNCIKKSFKKLTYSNYNIIVIDDGSMDNCSEILKDIFPDITVIRNKRYLGLCKAYNIGIREALKNNADYVFIASNDTKDYSTNYLEEVVKAFTKDNKVGMVGTKVFTYDGKPDWGGENHRRFCIDMNIPTCGYVIKREVFEKIGLLDEVLLFAFEDLDFIMRLRKVGYKTSFVSTVSYKHMGCGTKSLFGFDFNYYRVRNIFWFIKKHSSDIPLMCKIKEVVGSMRTHVKIVLSCCKQRKIKDLIKVMGFIFWGLIVGIFLPYRRNKKNK